MFKSQDDDQESLPSWLKTDNMETTSKARAQLTSSTPKKNYGSTNSNVQVNYGEVPMPPDSPPPPPVMSTSDAENGDPDWVNSSNAISNEEESSSEEEDSSEEDIDESDDDSSEESSEASENERLIPSEYELAEEEEDANKNRKNSRKSKKKNAKGKRPHRNCCHSFFILIQMISIGVNLAMMAVQLVPIFLWKQLVLEHKVMRCYLAFFNFFFILAEFDIHADFSNWMKRGVVYTFMGIVALDQRESMAKYGILNSKYDTSVGEAWNQLWASIFIEATSWSIIGVGCLYFLLGLLCMQKIRDRLRKQYQQKLGEYIRNKQGKNK